MTDEQLREVLRRHRERVEGEDVEGEGLSTGTGALMFLVGLWVVAQAVDRKLPR